jgi:hypothetical protein
MEKLGDKLIRRARSRRPAGKIDKAVDDVKN